MKRYIRDIFEKIVRVTSKAAHYVLIYLPIKTYQPVHWGREGHSNSTRACADRWASLSRHLGNGLSILDIGCNVGYFTFKAAEQGNLAIGIDSDILYITACRLIGESTGCTDAQFLRRNVDKDFIDKVPTFDVIFHFSVFHHWVKTHGEERSKEMMRALAAKCSVMYFETGQPNEVGTKWSEKLNFMGEQPEKWIATFLREIGFTEVDIIGTFPTGLTDVDRYLFMARK